MEYTGRDAGEVVAVVPPIKGEASIEKLAINAVMAGCRPEYMPIIVAAVQAMTEPQFNLDGIQTTTSPVTPMLIINGPIRHEINLNCSSGVLGPGWQANATMGRAIRLILLNLGGAVPGKVSMSTHAFPGRYTLCMGELEEENPWEPLHVERGFSMHEDTVTVAGINCVTNICANSSSPEEVIKTIEHSIVNIGSNDFRLGLGESALLLCPMHAHMLKSLFPAKNDLKRHLWERGRAPLEWLSKRHTEHVGFAERVIDGKVPIIRRWQDFMILVAGGPGGLHSPLLTTFGDTKSVTKPIPRSTRSDSPKHMLP